MSHADENLRRFSDPAKYDISIDWDDDPDGSDGGYDGHGNFIAPPAMMEIIELRAHIERLEMLLTECADDLAERVDEEHPDRETYPDIMRRYERDMDCVYRARAARLRREEER
jgi:hypothetical protein